MGRYINPGSAGFLRITNGKYVDKTGLIHLINDSISATENLTCISRPRRFGKSFASQMLSAYVIKFAYIAGVEQYMKVEELPSGHGIADVVFIPKRRSLLPALVVELKWNRSAGGAITQIKEKNYPSVLKDCGGDIVLAGINYDDQSKQHSCRIETIMQEETGITGGFLRKR